VSNFLNSAPSSCLKTLIVKGAEEDNLIALVLRGDHELNEIKAEKLEQIAEPLTMASDEEIRATIGCSVGSIGPVGLDIPIIADRSALHVADFICGANSDGKHLTGVNWERDLPEPISADLRNVEEGDPSPDGKGTLTIARGIEVGHIFQLGKNYSEAMKANVLNENGQSITMTMGCYGIGVSRVVAAAIEQSHDDRGIIWPTALAPFQVALLPMKLNKSYRVQEVIEKLYQQFQELGIDVLLDDRNVRPGFMFADMELIGIPHRIVLGERGVDDGQVEYRGRQDTESRLIPLDNIIPFIREQLSKDSGQNSK